MQTFYNYFMVKPLINYKQAKRSLVRSSKILGKDKDKEWQKNTNVFLNLFKKQNPFYKYTSIIISLGLGIFILSVWIYAIILAFK